MNFDFFGKLNKNGLSLVEIMVAISILSIAFIGLIQAFPFGLSINKEANDSTIASYLCQEKLEKVISLGYDNINTGVIEIRHRLSDDIDSYLYGYEGMTEVSYVDGNLNTVGIDQGIKKISSTVYYVNAISKSEKIYNITTLISQR